MKQIISLFFAVSTIFSCWAQQIEVTGSFVDDPYNVGTFSTIDHSTMECIYNHTITDTINIDVRNGFEILQIGNTLSHYGSYGEYRVDSILIHRKINQLSFREYSSISSKYNNAKNRLGYTVVIKNQKLNKLDIYDKVFIDNYVYSEPIPDFNWTLSAEEATFCGYKCKKASCRFRGRQWIAWYTEEIPVDNGPWKFSGLPGLILHIEDSNSEHVFTAISVRIGNSDIYLDDKEYLKTTRKKFNKELYDYKNNPGQFVNMSHVAPKNADGSPARIPKRRLFFNPIELE